MQGLLLPETPMPLPKSHLIPHGLIGLLAVVMAAFTLPAYSKTTFNSGLADVTAPALSLGGTAGAIPLVWRKPA